MEHRLRIDDWKLSEEGWAPELNLSAERLFALSSASQTARGHFEELFSGPTQRLSRLAAANESGVDWLAIGIEIDGKKLDLADCLVSDFRRSLSLRDATLERVCTVTTRAGKILKIYAKRFLKLGEPEIGAVRYALVPINFNGRLAFEPSIWLDLAAWRPVFQEIELENASMAAQSDSGAALAAAMRFTVYQDGEEIDFESRQLAEPGRWGCRVEVEAEPMQATILFKFAAQLFDASGRKSPESLAEKAKKAATKAFKKGFSPLLKEQTAAWAAFWEAADFALDAPTSVRAGLRFSVFQLAQHQPSDRFLLPMPLFLAVHGPEKAAKMLSEAARKRSALAERAELALQLEAFRNWAGRPVFLPEKELVWQLDLGRSLFADRAAGPFCAAALRTAAERLKALKKADPESFKALVVAQKFEEKKELAGWSDSFAVPSENLETTPELPIRLAEMAQNELFHWQNRHAEPFDFETMQAAWSLFFEKTMGIAPRQDRLAISPALAFEQALASASATFKGARFSIRAEGASVSVELLEGPSSSVVCFGKSQKTTIGKAVVFEKSH